MNKQANKMIPATQTFLLAVLFFVMLIGGLLVLNCSSQSEAVKIHFKHGIIDRNTPERLACKAVGDINGDGFVDVIAGGERNGGKLVWYAYPNWAKTVIDTGDFFVDMQVCDIDRDGDLDIVVPKVIGDNRRVLWYENPKPTGNPARDTWIPHIIGDVPLAHDVEVGDVDADGDVDVVTRGDGITALFLQNTPTSWTKVIISTSSGEGTALGDIDRDGDLDVIQDGYWLEAPNNKVSGIWVRHYIDKNWPNRVGVHVADMNRDNRLEVLLAPSESIGRLSWYEVPSDPKTGTWTEHLIDSDVSHIHTFKTADMDNDGNLDIVTAEMHQSARKRVVIYFNGGNSLTWTYQIVATTGSHNIRIADIGNDSDIDIVGANWGDSYHPVEMWENLGRPPTLNNQKRRVIDSEKP